MLTLWAKYYSKLLNTVMHLIFTRALWSRNDTIIFQMRKLRHEFEPRQSSSGSTLLTSSLCCLLAKYHEQHFVGSVRLLNQSFI